MPLWLVSSTTALWQINAGDLRDNLPRPDAEASRTREGLR